MSVVAKSLSAYRAQDARFDAANAFIEFDLLSKPQADSYAAMLILLNSQERQLYNMLETASEHGKAYDALEAAILAVRGANDQVRQVLKNHAVAVTAEKRAKKAAVN